MRDQDRRTLECWGSDGDGQVSGPNAEGGTFTQVSAGNAHTCAIKTAGTLECWGNDGVGRLGGAPAAPGPAPASPAGAGAYEHAFTSGTGTPSGAFTVSAGSLPPGLALSAAGVLSGTPTGRARSRSR